MWDLWVVAATAVAAEEGGGGGDLFSGLPIHQGGIGGKGEKIIFNAFHREMPARREKGRL